MHTYMILVEVPSTSLLYGVKGMNTNSKVEIVGRTKANNSSSACSKASKKLGIPYKKLKALRYHINDNGRFEFFKYQA